MRQVVALLCAVLLSGSGPDVALDPPVRISWAKALHLHCILEKTESWEQIGDVRCLKHRRPLQGENLCLRIA